MRAATDVFSEWADLGRDAGMELGHGAAVTEILAAALDELDVDAFTAIDAGCGNGWVVRMLDAIESCGSAIGVDGAASMIAKANTIDPGGSYHQADLEDWTPHEAAHLVHSMEVLYYLDDIPAFLGRVRSDWLSEGGILAIGVDHYLENEACHGWSEEVGVEMAMLSESEWREMVETAGFRILRMFRAAPREEWAGTLAIVARKTS